MQRNAEENASGESEHRDRGTGRMARIAQESIRRKETIWLKLAAMTENTVAPDRMPVEITSRLFQRTRPPVRSATLFSNSRDNSLVRAYIRACLRNAIDTASPPLSELISARTPSSSLCISFLDLNPVCVIPRESVLSLKRTIFWETATTRHHPLWNTPTLYGRNGTEPMEG